MKYRIRNWEKFQHYSTRRPLWIKFYVGDLIHDPAYMRLSHAQRGTLALAWAMASEKAGECPAPRAMELRIEAESGVSQKVSFDGLLGSWIEEVSDASEVSQTLASTVSEPPAMPEERRLDEKRDISAREDEPDANDQLDAEIDVEERCLLRNLVAIRDLGNEDPQAVCDSLERPKGQAPFNAFRALIGGKSGIPRTAGGLTVRRRLNDALEHRERSSGVVVMGEKNKASFDAIDRVAGLVPSGPRRLEGAR